MEGLAEIITDFFNSIGHKRTKHVRPNDRVCPLYPQKRTSFRSFSPPALGERAHRSLARRLIAVSA
jgi:hypothetical protein